MPAAALGDFTDELTGQLIAQGPLDIQSYLFGANPISFDYGGELQYEVNAVAAGYLCATIDLTLGPGQVHVRLNLHDVFVDYAFHGWLDDLPDPGFDCSGRVVASRVSVWTEFALVPSGGAPGEVEVTQLTPLTPELPVWGFDHFGSCADIAEIVDALPGIGLDVEGMIIQSALEQLEDANEAQGWLETEIERVIASLKVNGQVEGALGVQVEGDVTKIELDAEGVELGFDVALAGTPSPFANTYAYPLQTLQHTALDPVSGAPYDLSVRRRAPNRQPTAAAQVPESSRARSPCTTWTSAGARCR